MASPEPSVAALPDPCDLLTYEVAYAALRGAVGTDPTGNPLTCMWGRHPQPGALPPNDTRPLILLRVLDPNVVEQTASGAPGVTITPVAGLGDEAFFSKVGTASSDLFVRQGTVAFRVTVTDIERPDDEYYKQTEEAVAREILKRL